MVDLDQLNPQQRDAACQFTGPMMILAGAGTGKTRVVTARIAYMLASGVAPQNIAAMTFTNKAAKEMKERVGAMVNPALSKKLSISTFHSFCLQILRQAPKLAGLGGGTFSLVSTSDQLDLVRRALTEKGWAGLYKAEDLLFQIGICKNWLLTPARMAAGDVPPVPMADPELVATVYELYERQLRLNRAIDFDDCILKVVLLLREHPAQRDRLAARYRYLLVDEFQDTNASQFAVLEELAVGHGNICVVGDDDQSIYSWRGAMYETLERFEQCFKGTKIVKLEQNYRCSNIILNAANAVIKNNQRRKDKTLWSESTSEAPLVIAPFEDPVEEARWIAERCLSLIGSGHIYKDIAILYRANNQAKLIEMALRECSLVYKTYGGQSFFERQEVRDFLSYLRLIVNVDDHLALWRIINTPARGIGLKTQEGIEAMALERKKSPFGVMSDATCELLMPSKSAAAVAEFVATIQRLRALPLATPADVEALGNELITSFHLVDHVKAMSKNILSRQRKLENLRSLPAWLRKTADDYLSNHGKLNAYELLDYLTLNEAPQQQKDEENKNHISLMTIHASKGLEFPVVFVIGLEEGSLPHKNSLATNESVCEERRLFYVALTRAKEKCHLTYAMMRQSGFQMEARKKSRFLAELPAEGSQQLRGKEAPRLSREEQEAQRKQGTLSKLSQIRERLLRGEL